nr:ABC transporter permease subunit [Actinomadura glauciflava]
MAGPGRPERSGGRPVPGRPHRVRRDDRAEGRGGHRAQRVHRRRHQDHPVRHADRAGGDRDAGGAVRDGRVPARDAAHDVRGRTPARPGAGGQGGRGGPGVPGGGAGGGVRVGAARRAGGARARAGGAAPERRRGAARRRRHGGAVRRDRRALAGGRGDRAARRARDHDRAAAPARPADRGDRAAAVGGAVAGAPHPRGRVRDPADRRPLRPVDRSVGGPRGAVPVRGGRPGGGRAAGREARRVTGRAWTGLHALHAEWTKLRTVPSTAWLAPALAVLVAAVGAAVTGTVDTSHCTTPAGCVEDTPKLALSGVQVGQVAAVVLGVLAVGGEYAAGTIAATLAAVPGRITVLAAKAAVVAGLVAAGGTAGVLASLAAGRGVLPGNGFTAANGYPPLSLADGPTARAAAGTVLYLVLVALLALGVGTVLREPAAAISAVLALLWIVPVVTRLVGDDAWRERLEKAAPMTAGLAVQVTRGVDRLPIGPWEGLGVLAAYTAAALLAGGAVLTARDA